MLEEIVLNKYPDNQKPLSQRLIDYVNSQSNKYTALCRVFVFLYGGVGMNYSRFGKIYALCDKDVQTTVNFLLKHCWSMPSNPYDYLTAILSKRYIDMPDF
jgi:hypothetical protein